LFKNILGDPLFDLDIDGFQGNFQGNNDLQVNLTSQIGGLQGEFRQTARLTFQTKVLYIPTQYMQASSPLGM
jgi:hypothetical protein